MDVQNKIKAGFIVIIAIFVSIWLGVSVVTDQTQTVLTVAAVAGLLICLFSGQRIWLIYFFLAGLDINLMRGFATKELGQVLLIGFCGLLFLMRRLKIHYVFNEIDFWRLMLAMALFQVYLRNPVSLGILKGGSVGGKPYLFSMIALVAGFILSKLRVPANEIKWAVVISTLASLLSGPLNALRGGGPAGPSGMQQVSAESGGADGGSARASILIPYANLASKILITRISPLKAAFHPLWAPVILFSLALAGMSGYRNAVASIGLLYLVGIAYRGGFIQLLASCLLGAFFLGALALINLNYPLPGKVQRALSPFPGTWEQKYVDAGNISTEWRLEMWREALLTDTWIQNKILGDGLGFTRIELERMQASDKGGSVGFSGLNRQQENMMISGSYHSGPVQTIRTIGYVGLAILLLAMTRVAVHAHREIMRCKGTEWYTWSLFVMTPFIMTPIFFVFIFGEFTAGVTYVFISSAIIQLFQNNLPLPPYKKAKRQPYILGRRFAADEARTVHRPRFQR